MNFAARFKDTTYGKFASDYQVLFESNVKCLNYFDLDAASFISDLTEKLQHLVQKQNIFPKTSRDV